jgi:hypothetical protein
MAALLLSQNHSVDGSALCAKGGADSLLFPSSTHVRDRVPVRWAGILSAALAGLVFALPSRAASLHLVDSSFDAPPVSRLFLVDPSTGDLTLEADLDSSYGPYLGLAALDATRFYMTGTDASCGPELQGCILLEVELTPPSTIPTITPLGTITDAGTGLILIGVVGLTYRSDGILYAISEDTDSLYVLDPATAEATLVGAAGIDLHGGDITFDGEGRLWDWTNIGLSSGLYQLDPESGEAGPGDTAADLAFTGLTALGHGNEMYGCSPGTNALYGVDAATGVTGFILPLVLSGSSYDITRGDMDSPFCESDAACDDSESCTADTCQPGGCDQAPIPGCCHDEGFVPQSTSCGAGECAAAGGTSCVSGSVHDSCTPGAPSPEVCDGLDNDCDGSVDQGLADADADSVCDGVDNCPSNANSGQQDLDGDGAGDACDFGVSNPVAGAILDCRSGVPAPTIAWTSGAYDRYRVEISWLPDFTSKITSGSTLLKTTSWRPGTLKWKRLCARSDTSLHVRVLGVDRERSKLDPERKVYTPVVSVSVQH